MRVINLLSLEFVELVVGESPERVVQMGADFEAVPRQLDGRREEVSPGKPSVLLVSVPHSAHLGRNCGPDHAYNTIKMFSDGAKGEWHAGIQFPPPSPGGEFAIPKPFSYGACTSLWRSIEKKGQKIFGHARVDSNSQTSVPQRSALPMTPQTRRCVMWCIDGINLFISCAIHRLNTAP